jgi:cytochrome c peroxidase
MRHWLLLITVCVFCISGCTKKDDSVSMENLSPGNPNVNPADAPMNSEAARIQLGRVLFYDTKLSFNNKVSCGSCHEQNAAFGSSKQFDSGAQGNILRRNTPAILGDNRPLFWDGRESNIKDLVFGPLTSHNEMMQDLNVLPGKLGAVAYYPALFERAYGTKEVTLERIKDAVSTFCRNLTPSGTTFQSFVFINNLNNAESLIKNSNGLTESQKNGALLFIGKAKCIKCHTDGITSDGGYSNNTTTNTSSAFKNIGLDQVYEDKGLGALTHNTKDDGLFRMPRLINITFSGPYMHDGRYNTLEQVVEHYNSGIQSNSNLSKELCDSSKLVQGQIVPVKLNLSEVEKSSLVEFLKMLENKEVMTNKKNSNPFN